MGPFFQNVQNFECLVFAIQNFLNFRVGPIHANTRKVWKRGLYFEGGKSDLAVSGSEANELSKKTVYLDSIQLLCTNQFEYYTEDQYEEI